MGKIIALANQKGGVGKNYANYFSGFGSKAVSEGVKSLYLTIPLLYGYMGVS